MKRTQVVLVDDIDGGAADDTIVFSFKGVSYEIDLSNEHIEEMTADFEKWILKGRRVGGRQARSRFVRPRGESFSSRVRTWAKGEGIEVNERGRIPTEIVTAYKAAHEG